MKKNHLKTARLGCAVILSCGALAAASGCGKTTTAAATDTSVTVAGTLNATSSSSTARIARVASNSLITEDAAFEESLSIPRASLSLDLTTLSIYCVTFALPPSAGTASIGATGAFSVNLANASGAPFGCFIVKTATNAQVATLVFKDSTKTNMDGGAKTDSKIALSGNANFGTISLDVDSGLATADVANVAAQVTAPAVVADHFDPTGTWKFTDVDFTLPTGYVKLCSGHSRDCQGPANGDTIFLNRLAGKDFTPDATCASAVAADSAITTCNGTTGTGAKYAAGIWQSQAAFTGCGSKLGFTIAQARAKAHLDLTGITGVSEGDFTWDAGWTEGWKNVGSALSSFAISDCRKVQVTHPVNGNQVLAQACKMKDAGNSNAVVWNVGLDSGCKLADGSPAMLTGNWPNGGSPTVLGSTGFSSFSSTGTAMVQRPDGTTASVSVTCGGINGFFADSSSAPNLATPYVMTGPSNIQQDVKVAQNAACSGIADSLNQQRCYADYYQQHGRDAAGCIKKMRFDWGSSDPLHFVLGSHGPARANSEFALSLLDYAANGTMALSSDDEDEQGFQSGNQFVSCRVRNGFTITMTKVSDTKLQAEFVSETKVIDQNPACQAYAASNAGTFRSIAYMTKQ